LFHHYGGGTRQRWFLVVECIGIIERFIICEVGAQLARDNGLALSFFRSGRMIAGPFIALEGDVRRLLCQWNRR
jgi:hypothetical protein